jgi:hypothetical protein
MIAVMHKTINENKDSKTPSAGTILAYLDTMAKTIFFL